MKNQEIVGDTVGYLQFISEDKKVIIRATKGTETLATASDVFSYIDSNFKDWGCDKTEQVTPEISVEVYEQIEDATYSKIFGSFN